MDTINAEVIFKRYQFSDLNDNYLIADVDMFKKTIMVHVPWIWRLSPWKTDTYWKWNSIRNRAITHLQKQYGFTNIIYK